ncbi:MAG: hypothetical protein M3Y59_12400, partial [Myxococcota bacterium]|nr:hypothetical protein [Myxococcota bacterium]
LLELEAARAVLTRPGVERPARLRAQGQSLAALTAAGPLRLRLDDLELAEGSTQRGADLRALAGRTDLPFGPELERAVEEAAAAPRIRILVDCDQRLPFAVALCARLAKRADQPPPTLCGPFAVRHQSALESLFPGLAFDAALPTWTLDGAAWRWDGQPPVSAGPWRGYLPLEALAAAEGPPPRLAVVPFLALDEARGVLSLEGRWFPRALLEEAAARFTVVGEWHFGAPIPAALTEQSAALLLASATEAGPSLSFAWLGGLRRFHWSVDRPGQARFDGLPLALEATGADLDLARSRSFHTPGMLEETALDALVRRVLVALAQAPRPPSPGRVGAGLATVRPASAPGGDWLRLAGDAALVELPLTLEGKAQPTAVATSLGTGALLSLDPRLLPFLRRLERPCREGEFLPGVNPAMRQKLLHTLLERGILQRLPEGGAA